MDTKRKIRNVKHVLAIFALFAAFSMPSNAINTKDGKVITNDLKSEQSNLTKADLPTLRFVLSKTKVKGGYNVHATLLDGDSSELKINKDNQLTFTWAIKYANQPLEETEQDNLQDLFVAFEGETKEAIVLLKVEDRNSSTVITQSLKIRPKDIYYIKNQQILVKEDGTIYGRNGTIYDYINAEIQIEPLAEKKEEAKEEKAHYTKMLVLSPFAELREDNDVTLLGTPINRSIPLHELEKIRKSEVNKSYLYILYLYNQEGELIQRLSLTLTRK